MNVGGETACFSEGCICLCHWNEGQHLNKKKNKKLETARFTSSLKTKEIKVKKKLSPWLRMGINKIIAIQYPMIAII